MGPCCRAPPGRISCRKKARSTTKIHSLLQHSSGCRRGVGGGGGKYIAGLISGRKVRGVLRNKLSEGSTGLSEVKR